MLYSISQLTSGCLHQLFKRTSLKLGSGSTQTTLPAGKTCCRLASSTSVFTGSWESVNSTVVSSGTAERAWSNIPEECHFPSQLQGWQRRATWDSPANCGTSDVFHHKVQEAESISPSQHLAEQEPHTPGKYRAQYKTLSQSFPAFFPLLSWEKTKILCLDCIICGLFLVEQQKQY